MNAIASGAVGGLVATLPMTGAMNLLHRQLPFYQRDALPPHLITKRLTRAIGVHHRLTSGQRHALTLASHYSYGTAAGSLFGIVAPQSRAASVSAGIGFGLVVWAGSYLGLLPALGILTPATRHSARRNLLMIVAHVVWGATLGALVRALHERGLRSSQARSRNASRRGTGPAA